MEITLTIADAAAATGLSQKALRRRIERGTLPSARVDGARRIPLHALLEQGLMTDGAPARHPPAPAVPAPTLSVGESSDDVIVLLLDRLERVVAENERLRLVARRAQSLRG